MKYGIIFLKIMFFIIPFAGLLCLMFFYLDIVNYLLEKQIFYEGNLWHAGAALFLFFYFSWRPYKWAEYVLSGIIRDLEKKDL